MGGSNSMVTRAAALPGRATKMVISSKHYVLSSQMEGPYPPNYQKVCHNCCVPAESGFCAVGSEACEPNIMGRTCICIW